MQNQIVLNPILWDKKERHKRRITDIIVATLSVLMVIYIFAYGVETHIPYENIQLQSAVITNSDNTNKVLNGENLENIEKQLNALKLYNPIEKDSLDYKCKLAFEDVDNNKYELYIGDGWVRNNQGTFKVMYEFTDYITEMQEEEKEEDG